MYVFLSRQDSHTAAMMGADTVALCEMQGFSPRLENEKQSRTEANIVGYKAEFAVARVLNLELPEINVLSDGGVDLWMNDHSIDVKFTNMNKDPVLIFDSMAKFRAEFAILVTDETIDGEDCFKIHGWISRREFKQRHGTTNFGYGERLTMPADALRPIETFWGRMTAEKMGTLHSWVADKEGLV